MTESILSKLDAEPVRIPLRIDRVLYELNGPAIFVSRFGLTEMLFFKGEEIAGGEFFLATPIDAETVGQLEAGRVSLLGALSRSELLGIRVNYNGIIDRIGPLSFEVARPFIPRGGVGLYASHGSGLPDVVNATDSAFAFKYIGQELATGEMPFGLFRSLVSNTYDALRRTIVPEILRRGRNREVLEFPLLQPALASLFIPIGEPRIDGELFQKRKIKADPDLVRQQAKEEGERFSSLIEKTAELATSNKLDETFVGENLDFLHDVLELFPDDRSDVSQLTFASNYGNKFSAEVSRKHGQRIVEKYKIVVSREVVRTGAIVGQTEKTNRLLLRDIHGREFTAYLNPSIYDRLLANGDLTIGKRLKLKGSLSKRLQRDLLEVRGEPEVLSK